MSTQSQMIEVTVPKLVLDVVEVTGLPPDKEALVSFCKALTEQVIKRMESTKPQA